ncbi:MAG TPA: terminase family protein, partial [Chitinophagales bacterium]|nr:terminase family protein [Chitinophagales bacterium]
MNKALVYNRPEAIKRYKKQCEFIDAPQRYTIIEATTKAGKTVGCIVWLFEQALQAKAGDNFYWVAPIVAQAKIAFRRLQRFFTHKDLYDVNKADLTLTLFNGATIFFKSGDNPDSLYGDDVKAVVIDEATRMS